MSGYNGWANYETWRVNLEFFDGMTFEDFSLTLSEDKEETVETLATILEEMAAEHVEMHASGFALDLANNFLQRVDWEEIAEHFVADYEQELA